MENLDWDVLEEADWLFRKMVRRFVKERDRINIEGVALPGMMILHKIIREGEQRLSDLAEQLDLTSGAITALCDKLDAAGYTVRQRKEGDRRTVLLGITDKGRAMFERNRSVGARCITLLFEGFELEELNAQNRALEKVIGNLEGFSEAILEHAKQNAEAPAPGGPERKQGRVSTQSRYLTY
ncbi:DNA-binding transcriptional regulator, MarR family [Paenibacillus sophorae]|uniref:DNA-binding transcriptional regulator, MarR family n=1 Tax=Paenibacillus sophorae TaxID=1333845 RepID=A0A1H8PD85_9BACL|nr:winged helix DNA-binding protein [Paenibacillus sophorae]QWU16529.1 winged helix DNA-binding protein [Paenibacillus sophorae]SEO39717.1 DNA-binding transcriptional regulator, MarR family [Paenibacillus sophorae]